MKKLFLGFLLIFLASFSTASAAEKFTPAGSKHGPKIFVQMGHNFVVVYK